ncbi:mucolipin-3-like [Dysidea avara]|uniref:mucolipin-3-like n=1 Tax=Dysidea avara TaxID=196820 RepID=UPI003325DA75
MLKNTEDSKDKSTNYKQRMLSFLYGLISLLIRYFVIACLNHGKTRPQSYAQEEEKFESSRFVLREKLRHQFKNHIEKWTDKEFPLFPWKTLLHVVLIGLVTAQGVVYVSETQNITTFLRESTTAFKLYFVPATRIYTLNEVYTQIAHTVVSYYNITNQSLISYNFMNDTVTSEDPLDLTMKIGFIANNDTEDIDFEVLKVFPPGEACIRNSGACCGGDDSNDCFTGSGDCDCDITDQISGYINEGTINQIKIVVFDFTLSSYFKKHVIDDYNPVHVEIRFSITLKSDLFIGMNVIGDLDVKLRRDHTGQKFRTKSTILDIFAMAAIISSSTLILYSFYVTIRLGKEAKEYFYKYREENLRWHCELFQLFNKWYILMLFTYILNICATILKMVSEYKENIVIELVEVVRILLGIGILLLWCGLFGFLKYFESLNVLFITVRLAIPSVLRFSLCMVILFIAFALCGWLVLSPYHPKFQSFSQSVETLFCMLNGDDLYETFEDSDSTFLSSLTEIFSKVYFAVFVFIFIYAALSLFIGLFTAAYDELSNSWPPTGTISRGYLRDWITELLKDDDKLRSEMKKRFPFPVSPPQIEFDVKKKELKQNTVDNHGKTEDATTSLSHYDEPRYPNKVSHDQLRPYSSAATVSTFNHSNKDADLSTKSLTVYYHSHQIKCLAPEPPRVKTQEHQGWYSNDGFDGGTETNTFSNWTLNSSNKMQETNGRGNEDPNDHFVENTGEVDHGND